MGGRLMAALGVALLLAACRLSAPDLAQRLGCESRLFEESLVQTSSFFDAPIDAAFVLCRTREHDPDGADLVILDSRGNVEIERFHDVRISPYVSPGEAMKLAPLGDWPPDVLPEPGDDNYPEGGLFVSTFDLSPELVKRGVTRSTQQVVIGDSGTSRRWYVHSGEWRRYLLH